MSGFRSLVPNQLGESSSSSPAKSSQKDTSTGLTSGSGGVDDGDNGKGSGTSNKRRRGAGSVSSKACNRCRAARQKCDGIEPGKCSKCVQHGVPCVWEPHTKESKDDLIQQILQLQNRNREMSEETTKNKEEQKEYQQTTQWQSTILQTIGSNGHDREIIERLRSGQTPQKIADWLAAEDPSYQSVGGGSSNRLTLTEVVKLFEDQCQNYDGLEEYHSRYSSRTRWTEVTNDHRLIGHLFDLFFTWVHPMHTLFSESDFLREFQRNTSENDNSYCGTVLVNAICAMACHLLDSDKLQRGSHIFNDKKGINAGRLREAFMAEARKDLTQTTYNQMKSVQAFALLYLVDWSSGRARHGLGYLRSAAEYLDNDFTGQSRAAVEITVWGIKTLITACVGTTYEVLYTRSVPPSEDIFQHVDPREGENDAWSFYRQPGEEKEMPTVYKHGLLTAYHRANLFRYADQILRMYCGALGKVKARPIIDLYKGLLAWEDQLPGIMQVGDDDGNPLPHVISLHVQLHAIAVQLLNPLAQSGYFKGQNLSRIQDSITYHATIGLKHLTLTHRLYTARFHMPVISFCALHLADAMMVYNPARGTEALGTALEALQEAAAGFEVCGPLLGLVYQRAQSLNISIPSDKSPVKSGKAHPGLDEILDACTRPMYTQPLNQIRAHMDPNIAKEWAESEAPSALRRSSSPGADKMQIDSLLNMDEK